MGVYVDSMSAIRAAADASGTPTTHIGPSLGKSSSYFSAYASRGSDPSAGNVARMLGVCGWALVAVPADEIPAGALVIDPAE